MCLLLTACAAITATLLWYFRDADKDLRLGFLALMYWGAALMWTVDGFFCVAEGEPFLDLSANDALLGLVIVVCGLIVWLLSLLIRDPRQKVLPGIRRA
ncbi:MAG: hypothetical protein K6B40_08000 [Firmicutes bacterium]|nr:hypothetical protein [Bacillota bacterium]